jgi:hypothetical protein
MSATFPEVTLDFWANRFISAGLRVVMTFEQYMRLSPALRERREQLMLQAEAMMALRIQRDCPDAALHGGALIEPFHHGKRRLRQPWFRNARNHV